MATKKKAAKKPATKKIVTKKKGVNTLDDGGVPPGDKPKPQKPPGA